MKLCDVLFTVGALITIVSAECIGIGVMGTYYCSCYYVRC